MKATYALLVVLVLIPAVSQAQMTTIGGFSGLLGPVGPQMIIGEDGNAYVLHQDLSVPATPKTTISAIAPVAATAGKTIWTASVPGLASSAVTGAGTVLVPTTTIPSFGIGALLPVLPSAFPMSTPGKLYFLNSATGAQAAVVDLTGTLQTLTVRTVGGTDYAYVVTRIYSATTGTLPISIQAKLQLTVYKMNGAVVTTLSATNESVREEQ